MPAVLIAAVSCSNPVLLFRATEMSHLHLPFKPKNENLNSPWLPLFIAYRNSGENLVKYQAKSSCVIMFFTLKTTLSLQSIDIPRRNLMLTSLKDLGIKSRPNKLHGSPIYYFLSEIGVKFERC